ncbi:glycoside hydrolase family 97 protein [Emticicia sp. BO119]|uniref:glycoside hydrolase family 97 protein n=1 Tax=Emticicia sp. BO119 TaxID=2757768 RepID=UPI0015F05A0E|nr:glycoside hydrolase family 97 protein [Emticicia sp. BO119]MBA4853220.1 glycoside hydrolase family 97 catalytic domain-containing protein [Emticicia sp. BO119]
MKNRLLFFLLSILFLISLKTIGQSWSVSSPNTKIKVTVELKQPDKNLIYYVEYIENATVDAVVNQSDLGVRRMDELFINNFSFEGSSTQIIDENYTNASGKKLNLRNHANEMTLSFKINNKLMDVVFRAYDDGIAFRYVFPETSGDEYYVTNENTTFQLPTDGNAWIQELPDFQPVYEKTFSNGTALSQPVLAQSALPALFRTSKFWLLLTEADLHDNFFASHLDAYSGNGTFRLAPPSQNDGNGFVNFAKSSLPWIMPWRVIMIGKENKVIVESNLVSHLSAPSTIADISWIKPGLSAWSWWSNLYSPTDFVATRDFIDFTSNFKLPYFLVDVDWNKMGNGGNIDDIIDYANTKDVKIWLWYNSGGPNNQIDAQPRDLMYDRQTRRNEFQRIKNLGVKGVKIDFFQSDKQEVIKQYIDILKDAADFQLMVNFHGSTSPKGWERTYPNLVTMEAVKGAEAYIFDGNSFRQKAPEHHTILPFTRNAVGSMDYTPVIIGEFRGVEHYTTDVHEIALLNTFESGETHLVDKAEGYLSLSPIAQKIVQGFPTTWDETHLIDGYPGTHVIMARRKGENWYISGINGLNAEKVINLNFSLIQNGEYLKQTLKDGDTPRHIVSSETNANIQTSLNINEVMKPYGGFVIVLERKSCQEAYTITNTTNDLLDEYKVSDKITSSVEIVPDRKVIYDAGKSIDLIIGFEVKPGATFNAKIGGCAD